MTPEDIIKNSENPKFEVNIGNALLRILEISSRNQRYLRTILQKQLEIKALLQGKTQSDLNDDFYDKVHDLEKEIWNISESDYNDLLYKVLDK